MYLTDPQRLALIRAAHTIIYLVMAASTLVLLYAGLTGQSGLWLWIAAVPVGVEVVVFVGYGFKCPLTAMAVRYGAEKGYAFDTFLPEAVTRRTFRVFGSILALAVILLILRALGLPIWRL